jgi:hypothetical protein
MLIGGYELIQTFSNKQKWTSPTCAASPLFQAHENFESAKRLSGLPKKNDNPGSFSGVAIKHRKFRSKVHQPKLMLRQITVP